VQRRFSSAPGGGPLPWATGSPETVAKKIQAAAESGLFNTFMGEFNFSDLPESDLMRSIRLFGEKVIPALRGYEPLLSRGPRRHPIRKKSLPKYLRLVAHAVPAHKMGAMNTSSCSIR
jgi:hypothetical protein